MLHDHRILMNVGMYQKLGQRDEEVLEKYINRRLLLYSSRNKLHQGPLHTAGYIFLKFIFQQDEVLLGADNLTLILIL